MTTPLQQAKARMQPGAVFDVTNHYITRTDHACFGTNRRTITKATSSSFYLSIGDHPGWAQAWPKATQVTVNGDTIEISGHPSAPEAPFLTLRHVTP